MLKRSTLETLMGLVVLTGAAIFAMLVYQASNIKSANGYLIHAEFGTTGGLSVGDEVRLSGIKVGQIVGQSLDPVTYAYRPAGHVLKGGRRNKATGDYEAWTP